MHFDDKTLTSKEVTITPPEAPKDGTVLIHKTDSENPNKGLKVPNEVRNSANEVVAKLKRTKKVFSTSNFSSWDV